VRFAREIFDIEPWDRQCDILHAVRDHGRVTVRSGHKVGKSNSAGLLAWWFACCFAGARVVMTSSSNRQVREVLWREILDLYKRRKRELPCPAERPDPGLRFDDNRQIIGFSTDEPEKMAGVSGSRLLFILDEASGIPESLFEAIEGNRAGGAKLVMFSNPTQTSGTFFESFHQKAHLWKTIHIDSRESPNVVAGRIVIPGLAFAEWVEEKLEDWGEESPIFQVRVAGNFPTQSDNAVIGLADVTSAGDRWDDLHAAWLAAPPPVAELDRLEIGVDVARFGDDETVVQPRRGALAFAPIAMQSQDSIQIAGRIVAYLKDHWTSEEPTFPRVKVDSGGGYGGGVVDQLRTHDWIEVVEVNSSCAPSDPEEYINLRSELWFGGREWLRAGGAIPRDGKLVADLVAPTYSLDGKDRRVVEPKKEIKKRLKRSPDRADALLLSIYDPPATTDDAVSAVGQATGALWG
jgi:phage terminase large subunit